MLRLHREEDGIYYREMEIIGDHATLRRLWIGEGKRRGYGWKKQS